MKNSFLELSLFHLHKIAKLLIDGFGVDESIVNFEINDNEIYLKWGSFDCVWIFMYYPKRNTYCIETNAFNSVGKQLATFGPIDYNSIVVLIESYLYGGKTELQTLEDYMSDKLAYYEPGEASALGLQILVDIETGNHDIEDFGDFETDSPGEKKIKSKEDPKDGFDFGDIAQLLNPN